MSNVVEKEKSLNSKGERLRIYIFNSEPTEGLHAFAGDPGGNELPKHHGPWNAVGIIPEERMPPYKLSRDTIEEAIGSVGFQLWRFNKQEESEA